LLEERERAVRERSSCPGDPARDQRLRPLIGRWSIRPRFGHGSTCPCHIHDILELLDIFTPGAPTCCPGRRYPASRPARYAEGVNTRAHIGAGDDVGVRRAPVEPERA